MKSKYLPYRSDFLKSIQEIKNLLIVVAMESEENALLSEVEHIEISYGKLSKTIAKQFVLANCNVTVARSGVGLVNAGILLHTIAEHQLIDAVILLGVGGALDSKLNVGDTVVSRQIVQHDSIASSDDGNFFIAPGELALSRPADQQIDPIMRCDSVLVDWISSTIESKHKGKTFQGTILSGSEFAGCSARKKSLRELFDDALLVDMEASALAQVARRLQIPFVAAKTVADRASPESSIAKDYKTFLDAATAHSASVLRGLTRSFS